MSDVVPADADDLMAAVDGLRRLFGSRGVSRRIAETADSDLSQQALRVVRALFRHGEQSIAGLADRALMDLAAVSRQLRVLEAGGYTRRRTDPDDTRVSRVTLTPKGRAVAARVLEVQRRHLDDAVGLWSATDRRQLAALLDRLVADLRATEFRPG